MVSMAPEGRKSILTMAQEKISIQNLKCGGCANTIKTRLEKIEGLSNLTINVENSELRFSLERVSIKLKVLEVLKNLGYPEVGSSNSIVNKASSYVSCAIGKMKS